MAQADSGDTIFASVYWPTPGEPRYVLLYGAFPTGSPPSWALQVPQVTDEGRQVVARTIYARPYEVSTDSLIDWLQGRIPIEAAREMVNEMAKAQPSWFAKHTSQHPG